MILEIKFTNDTTFKYVHDLLMDDKYEIIRFVEIDDGVNPNVAFVIANLIQTYNPQLKIVYETFRDELPIEELDPEIFFRGIPFDTFKLNEHVFNNKNGKIIKVL